MAGDHWVTSPLLPRQPPCPSNKRSISSVKCRINANGLVLKKSAGPANREGRLPPRSSPPPWRERSSDWLRCCSDVCLFTSTSAIFDTLLLYRFFDRFEAAASRGFNSQFYSSPSSGAWQGPKSECV